MEKPRRYTREKRPLERLDHNETIKDLRNIIRLMEVGYIDMDSFMRLVADGKINEGTALKIIKAYAKRNPKILPLVSQMELDLQENKNSAAITHSPANLIPIILSKLEPYGRNTLRSLTILALLLQATATSCSPTTEPEDASGRATAEAPAGTTPEATAEATAEVEQRNETDITEIEDELVKQAAEICKTDQMLCKAFEAYEASLTDRQEANKNIPTLEPQPTAVVIVKDGPTIRSQAIRDLATELYDTGVIWKGLSNEGEEKSIEFDVDSTTGQPFVTILIDDEAYGKAGTIIRPGIPGSEGLLVVTTDATEKRYGAAFDHLSAEGPCIVNAYDKDGELLGGVSSKTGQWVDANLLEDDDIKKAIAFEGKVEILAQQVLDGNTTLAEATADMSAEEKFEISKQMTLIQQRKMSYTPTLKVVRPGVDPTWFGLTEVTNDQKTQLVSPDWANKKYTPEEQLFNPQAKYWWRKITDGTEIDNLSMPDQLVPAYQDGDGMHYIDANGQEQIFTGTFPTSEEEIITQMSAMVREKNGKSYGESIKKYNMRAYAGILYQQATELDIMWNIDPTAIPKKGLCILIPVFNESGELLYMRKAYLLFNIQMCMWKREKNGEVTYHDYKTLAQTDIFFGDGSDPQQNGKLIYVTDLPYGGKPYGFSPQQFIAGPTITDGTDGMKSAQSPNDHTDLFVINAADFFLDAAGVSSP